MTALETIDDWPVTTAAAAVVTDGGTSSHGPIDTALPWASVTKVLFALAAWVAVEEGTLDLDMAAGPPGSTVRHLLAHTSGLGFDDTKVHAAPGTRRIYSNTGIEVAASVLESKSGMAWTEYVNQAVCDPLGMKGMKLDGSPASDAVGPLRDLAALAAELRTPTLVARETGATATSVVFPGVPGVLPGYGRQAENDWGLGVEVRGHKSPHWTPPEASPRTFGHFGRAGGFVWVDPDADLACAVLTDRAFGDWAVQAWPVFGSAVLGTPRG